MPLQQEILDFTKAFQSEFGEFLTPPNSESFPLDERKRIVIKNGHLILPAEIKFSDWDIYSYVDTEKITIPVLHQMRDFVLSWKGFELVRDYATCVPHHIDAHAYQSLGENGRRVYAIQFMGVIQESDFAPFVDIHIIGTDKSVMNSFYESICHPDQSGYLDWSILTYWRKMRRAGTNSHGDKESTVWRRSIMPAFSEDQQNQANTDPISFFSVYFENRSEFEVVVKFLKS